MIKKICPHCGKMYDSDAGKCNCIYSQRREQARRKRYDKFSRNKASASFYESLQWKLIRNTARHRDLNMDRLQFFLSDSAMRGRIAKLLSGKDETFRKVFSKLYYNLVDKNGFPKHIAVKSGLTVHHIIPRDDDKTLQLNLQNLITLTASTHSIVHSIYDADDKQKQACQQILQMAIFDK